MGFRCCNGHFDLGDVMTHYELEFYLGMIFGFFFGGFIGFGLGYVKGGKYDR